MLRKKANPGKTKFESITIPVLTFPYSFQVSVVQRLNNFYPAGSNALFGVHFILWMAIYPEDKVIWLLNN